MNSIQLRIVGGVAAVVFVCWLAFAGLHRRAAMARSNDGLIHVNFYGESLCPDCRHNVLDVLDPMFENGIAKNMKLRYIAYGKARDGKCQHGELECKYNRYINCAQDLWPRQEKWFPYVKCLAKDLQNIDAAAADCAVAQHWNPKDLDSCAQGDRGAALEQEAGQATTSLEPKLTLVPWVIVNGVLLGKDFENLARYVCAASTDDDRRGMGWGGGLRGLRGGVGVTDEASTPRFYSLSLLSSSHRHALLRPPACFTLGYEL